MLQRRGGKRQPEGKSVMFFSNHYFLFDPIIFIFCDQILIPLMKNKRLGGEPQCNSRAFRSSQVIIVIWKNSNKITTIKVLERKDDRDWKYVQYRLIESLIFILDLVVVSLWSLKLSCSRLDRSCWRIFNYAVVLFYSALWKLFRYNRRYSYRRTKYLAGLWIGAAAAAAVKV